MFRKGTSEARKRRRTAAQAVKQTAAELERVREGAVRLLARGNFRGAQDADLKLCILQIRKLLPRFEALSAHKLVALRITEAGTKINRSAVIEEAQELRATLALLARILSRLEREAYRRKLELRPWPGQNLVLVVLGELGIAQLQNL